jgi:predicted amidohydrolase
VGEGHIAVAGHGDDAFVGLLFEQLLEDGDHPGDGNGGGVAEVVDAERRGPALLAGFRAGVLAGSVERVEAALTTSSM